MRVPSLKIEACLLLMVWKSHETSTSAYIGNGVDILHVLAQGHVSDILNRRHAYLFISFILSALLSPQHSWCGTVWDGALGLQIQRRHPNRLPLLKESCLISSWVSSGAELWLLLVVVGLYCWLLLGSLCCASAGRSMEEASSLWLPEILTSVWSFGVRRYSSIGIDNSAKAGGLLIILISNCCTGSLTNRLFHLALRLPLDLRSHATAVLLHLGAHVLPTYPWRVRVISLIWVTCGSLVHGLSFVTDKL